MKLVLLKDVKNLGLTGQKVEVKDGYGRNYLIPQNLATRENDPRVHKLLAEINQKKMKLSEELKEFKSLADKINNQLFTIKAKAGESGKLFGAITASDIAKIISNKDIKVIAKQIETEPIKSLGEHKVMVKFAKDITAMIKLKVEENSKK